MAERVLLIDHAFERPKTDFRLIRLCEWAGYGFKDFPRLTLGENHDRPWQQYPDHVLFPMGPRATWRVGAGDINESRGYIGGADGFRFIPSYAPGFIQRGNAKYSAAFINDLQKAVYVSRHGLEPVFLSYALNPSPLVALQWAQEYVKCLREHPETYLAFDIETPGKGEDEDAADTDNDAPDRTWNIEQIGFSYRGHSAISFPWAPEYMAAIRLILGTDGPKVVWNAGFDVPRIRRAGVRIAGIIHDGMVAWHVLHSDLPKALRFVATFTCPEQPAWKHLSSSKPAFYNATDADVEFRSMVRIESELRKNGMWEVYQRDVIDLEPILVHMQQMGMPVDAEIRMEKAIKLAELTLDVTVNMEAAVPLEARKIAIVYKNTPKDLDGLLSRPGVRETPICTECGQERPRKDHFKRYVKKHNACANAGIATVHKDVVEYYRLAEFTPSRDQLIRYHDILGRPCPMVYDKKERKRKVSFAEKQLKKLRLQYPDDRLYESVLEYRSLDKLAGTYIGRPEE